MNEQQEQDVAELNRHAEYYTSHHPNSDVGMLLRRFLTHVKELEQQCALSVPVSEIRDLPMYNCCSDDDGAWEQKVKIGKFYLASDIEAIIAKSKEHA